MKRMICSLRDSEDRFLIKVKSFSLVLELRTVGKHLGGSIGRTFCIPEEGVWSLALMHTSTLNWSSDFWVLL